MWIILVLYIIFSINTFGLCVECPDGFYDLEGRCYYFANETSAWLEASRKCHEMGASLLAVETEKEAMLVFNQGVKLNVKNGAVRYWTSGLLTKMSNVQKPTFLWTSTWEPFTYTSWCDDQGFLQNDECCVQLRSFQKHSKKACWFEGSCVRSMVFYICETEPLSSALVCEACDKCKDCSAGGDGVDTEDDKMAYEITIRKI